MKLDNMVPNTATTDKNIKVAETNPTEKIINSFFSNLSSIILVVKTLPQKTIVIGFDNVNTNPCIKILADVGFKFSPGIIFIPKALKTIFIPNIIRTIEPIILKVFFIFSLSSNLLTPILANVI